MNIMQLHYLIIISIILLAGIIGGLVNYFKEKNEKKKGIELWLKHTVIGTAASILVPLFLEMISSNIIDTPLAIGFNKNYFIFMGFCLIAAITSNRFIDNIADKVFEKAKNAEKEAKEASRAAKELQDFATENDDTESTMNEKLSERIKNNDKLKEKYRKIILAIIKSNYAYRTVKGISEDAQLERKEVLELLNQLLKIGLVKRKVGKKGTYIWALINP